MEQQAEAEAGRGEAERGGQNPEAGVIERVRGADHLAGRGGGEIIPHHAPRNDGAGQRFGPKHLAAIGLAVCKRVEQDDRRGGHEQGDEEPIEEGSGGFPGGS